MGMRVAPHPRQGFRKNEKKLYFIVENLVFWPGFFTVLSINEQ
jgi:hypothetical protein